MNYPSCAALVFTDNNGAPHHYCRTTAPHDAFSELLFACDSCGAECAILVCGPLLRALEESRDDNGGRVPYACDSCAAAYRATLADA